MISYSLFQLVHCWIWFRFGTKRMKEVILFCLLFATIMSSFATAAGSSRNRLAIVTGSNKGIGKEISRKLLRNGCDVIVACRDVGRGTAAAEELNREGGGKAIFLPLDVSNSASIQSLKQTVERDFGKIDILVNNAATAFKGSDPTPFQRQARPTIMINFFGLLEVTRSLLPLLKLSEDPHIVNVASQAGHLSILPSQQRKAMFTSPTLTIPQLEGLMHEFVNDVEAGQHSQRGWPNTCYG